MADFVCVAKADEITRGQSRTVDVDGKTIAIFNVEGTFYAMDDTCVHRGGPLGQGKLEGNIVACPWHHWRFDVKTGISLTNPAARVGCYPTKIEGADILVSC